MPIAFRIITDKIKPGNPTIQPSNLCCWSGDATTDKMKISKPTKKQFSNSTIQQFSNPTIRQSNNSKNLQIKNL